MIKDNELKKIMDEETNGCMIEEWIKVFMDIGKTVIYALCR